MNVFITKAIEKVADAAKVFGEKITSGKDKDQANKELTETITGAMNEVIKLQSEVIKLELKGNWLQRSWRPILMLGFGFIVMYSKFIAPAFGLPNAELEPDFWTLLEIGIGGYVIGRSAEKITEKASGVIGQNLLRKKDRDL